MYKKDIIMYNTKYQGIGRDTNSCVYSDTLNNSHNTHHKLVSRMQVTGIQVPLSGFIRTKLMYTLPQ